MTDLPVPPGPGADAASALAVAPAAGDVAPAGEVTSEQISLGRRLRQPRTIVSILVPILVLVLLAVSLPGFRLDRLPGLILGADPWLLVAAFAVYYVGFPLRGLRWRLILRAASTEVSTRDATEIIYISWLVNCVVPAKLGDIYRAWLLRLNFAVSLSRTLGTVFIERIFDLFAIVLLGLAAGYWSFRAGMPREVQIIFGLGFAVVVLLALGLFTLRNFGRRLLNVLPVPERVVDLYERFEEGVFGLRTRQIPVIGALTVLIWSTEAARLYLVVQALGFAHVHLAVSSVAFVAFAASLLTAIPLTPAGLGFVEGAVVGLLTAVYHVPSDQALAITIVDRAISVLSVIVLGSLVYVVSPKTKGPSRGPAPGGVVGEMAAAASPAADGPTV
ncbi:MAG: lysylphosphatidylglycerol synthase transmembrane domain-containing protein [Candidatus Limnocylindrales bacterium]